MTVEDALKHPNWSMGILHKLPFPADLPCHVLPEQTDLPILHADHVPLPQTTSPPAQDEIPALINKGLEVMEAKWLFDVGLEQIQVVVHPQSILHSAVPWIAQSTPVSAKM